MDALHRRTAHVHSSTAEHRTAHSAQNSTERTVAQHPVLGEPCSTLPAVLTKNLESFPLLLLLTASPAPSLPAVLNRRFHFFSFLNLAESIGATILWNA